jgi:hypothetical protein
MYKLDAADQTVLRDYPEYVTFETPDAVKLPVHQENTRVVFEHLWGLWKDLKISKTLRLRIFGETGTNSLRDLIIFARLLIIFQR